MNTEHNLPIVCLMGPTAVGKSQLAIDLAEIFPCDIISVDSVMVYRKMNIGTAKPEPNTLSRIFHHLIDIREVTNPYSVGDFFQDAQYLIQQSLQNGRIPLLVGGTMLYFNALRKGLVDVPTYKRYPNYLQIKNELDQLNKDDLYKQLEQYDALTAKKLHSNDRQRVQRALLVYHLSKHSLSSWQVNHQRYLPYSMLWLAVYPKDRIYLRDRISSRFKTMLLKGLIEETILLSRDPGFSKELPAYRAVGYRQVIDYLHGKISFNELELKGTIASCQLAKRQLTWLKNWPNLIPLQSSDLHLVKHAKQAIEKSFSFK